MKKALSTLVFLCSSLAAQHTFADEIVRAFTNTRGETILLVRTSDNLNRLFWRPKFDEFDGFSPLMVKGAAQNEQLKYDTAIPIATNYSGDDSATVEVKEGEVVIKGLGVTKSNKMGVIADTYTQVSRMDLESLRDDLASGKTKLKSPANLDALVDNLITLSPIRGDLPSLSIQREILNPDQISMEIYVINGNQGVRHSLPLTEITRAESRFLNRLRTMTGFSVYRTFQTQDGSVIKVAIRPDGKFDTSEFTGTNLTRGMFTPSSEFSSKYFNNATSAEGFKLRVYSSDTGKIVPKNMKERMIMGERSAIARIDDPKPGQPRVKLVQIPHVFVQSPLLASPADSLIWENEANLRAPSVRINRCRSFYMN